MSESPPRIHPDGMVRRCFLWTAATPRIPPATRVATTVRRCAPACAARDCSSTTWGLKTTTGRGKNKRQLAEPLAICVLCGEPWDTWDEVDHMTTGAPGGGITRRGRWTRFIHVRSAMRGRPATSNEERMFGNLDLGHLLRLRAIARQLEQSHRWLWAARVYFAYVLRFQDGRGGERALTDWAAGRADGAHRADRWPQAPWPWTRKRVRLLIDEGRTEWARRLELAGLIEGGDWWHSTRFEPPGHPAGRKQESR